ncbi:hypothetical protein QMA80_17195 [Burkholderia pseudomallei]|nr:hypothetical protein [Burkholderia pseudomallei]
MRRPPIRTGNHGHGRAISVISPVERRDMNSEVHRRPEAACPDRVPLAPDAWRIDPGNLLRALTGGARPFAFRRYRHTPARAERAPSIVTNVRRRHARMS